MLPLRQGVFGDVILVNGVPRPFLPCERRKYIFRLLNSSDARFYVLRLSSGDSFSVIAADGGPMPQPVQDVMRFDVVADAETPAACRPTWRRRWTSTRRRPP
jgi:FtsP/CotA-like multicopper oxidase with cupredoxin domain